ncbi:hypothetical protein H4S08_000180 [Coemansia sp. RSA 1365]|nr:hypothetical protein H4S08_000180 [Coemansia sp. RSA 1365]
MKLTVASVLALASSAFAALSINNPVAGTVWSSDGKPVTVSWISDNGSPLTGTVSVELMEGTDQNDLKSVVNIASNIDAAVGDLTFTPPTDLAGSKYYAVRVTSSVDGMHYSHSFQAGDASITGAVSESVSSSKESADSSSSEESDDSKTDKETDDDSSSESTDEESESEESSDDTNTDTDSKTEKDIKTESDTTDKESSKGKTSSDETESETEETEENESSSSKDEEGTGGASRPAIAIGLLGLTAFVSMF